MTLNTSHVTDAYLYLKNYAYHENLNLFLKRDISEFEANKKNLQYTFRRIKNIINSEEPTGDEKLKSWINKINYHLLPKSIECKVAHNKEENNKGLFISNVRDAEKYQVSKVNYFINAPVEIHIIEMLWCLFAGPALEKAMNKDCYGNRMHPSSLIYSTENDELKGKEIFKRYIDQYNKWRDQAIKIATDTAKDGDDVALLSLDLKSYFYHVDLKFEKIENEIKEYYKNDATLENIAIKINNILEIIYLRYQKSISSGICKTHFKCKGKKGLPIGLASSAIIANWYLSDFDDIIHNHVRPAYYGRYVDDIIMVFKRPIISSTDPINAFIGKYLDGMLKTSSSIDEYVINIDENEIPIQKEKLILQFFDKNHSRAGLEVFKQELDEKSSAFKFLPSDHINKEMDKFAYDILYEGSSNKLRSIVGLAENETELAKYLSSHITAHRLCKLDKNSELLPQIKQFFKGKNALKFFRLWEKIYQYSVITQNYKFASFFFQYIQEEIYKIDVILPVSKRLSPSLTKKLHDDMLFYSKLSLCITIGLLDVKEEIKENLHFGHDDNSFYTPKRGLGHLIPYGSDLHIFSWQFRFSNLIRHHLVAWPLANYSDKKADLTNEIIFVNNYDFEIDDRKIKYSPRFIHFDEWQLFHLGKNLIPKNNLNDWMSETIDNYKEIFSAYNFPVFYKSDKKNSGVIKSHLKIKNNDKKEKLNLAIANIRVDESNILAALRKDCKPNISFDRQENLYRILNSAISEKSDLLVMPEVAIPVSWLPFMLAFSRRNQIGLIFGLEHWISDSVAYNLIIEALPFKISEKYNACVMTARIKNHYAPSEKELLESFRLTPGNSGFKPNSFYHKVSWQGVSFATYNCFELSDITHRVLFRSEIDLLFACVWNKDTNYYQHILESAVRDLHCYTVQSNTSQYGGSCVLRPTRTESKTMLYVKGGENPCVLTAKLDIKGLREFQYKSKPSLNDYFKHLPPGFDSDSILER